MKKDYIRLSVIALLVWSIFVCGIPQVASRQRSVSTGYKLTIYVDEGHGELYGHVFIGLTAGQTTIYAGFYSKDKSKALFEKGGGEVRNDESLVNECKWDVKQTYDISQSGYQAAMDGIYKWDVFGRQWSYDHHCGDFAEAIARMAGVQLDLPELFTGRNRPGLFGDYLRQNGGEARTGTFEVNSYVDTHMLVNRGDKVTIKASGTVNFGLWVAGDGTPEGISEANNLLLDPSYSYFPEWRHGCLLARVRTPDEDDLAGWWRTGRGTDKISQETGTLELGVNDNKTDDNRGTFKVTVEICRAKFPIRTTP